jgi:hypothetical protein
LGGICNREVAHPTYTTERNLALTSDSELEICLELPSSGIRTFQESLSLPTSSVDEEGLYYFLALISLRKLLAEVIETIGFKCECNYFKSEDYIG